MNSVLLGVILPSPPAPPGVPSINASEFAGTWTKTGLNQYHIEAVIVCMLNPPAPLGPNNFTRSRLIFDITLVPGAPGVATFDGSGVQTEYPVTNLALDMPGNSLAFAFHGLRVL